MSDEFRRLFEQQEALRRQMKIFDDLKRHIDPIGDTYKHLGIGTAMDFLRQEEERHKMLSGLANGVLAKTAQDFERQRKLLEGPVEEAKRLGLFDPRWDIHQSISATIEARQSYEHLFRLPKVSELGRIAHEAMARPGLVRTVLVTEAFLQSALATMQTPWLQIEESLASATALSEIIAMGRGIDSLPVFDHDFAAALRPGLGDWRDMLTPAFEPLIDPVLRSDFYVERGFNPDLTDFTASAFDEGLRIAGLLEPESIESVDDEEDSFVRARTAFDQLQRFEVAVRRFIQRVMHAAYGDDWMKRQLPATMLDGWIGKRATAVKAGHAEYPLIDYADFADYRAIIERKDNWNVVFKPVFGRAEDIRGVSGFLCVRSHLANFNASSQVRREALGEQNGELVFRGTPSDGWHFPIFRDVAQG